MRSDFSAVVCGSDLQALYAEWPEYGCAEDPKPSAHEESENVFVVVIDCRDAGDEGE